MEPILKQRGVVETKAGRRPRSAHPGRSHRSRTGYPLCCRTNTGISGYAEVDKLFGARFCKTNRSDFHPLGRV